MPSPCPTKHPNYQARPVLTLYADGMANLNGEAYRQLPPKSAALRLFAPASLEDPYWQLLPLAADANDVPLLAGSTALCERTDRLGQLRFRCSAMATALFACLPEGTRALRLELAPASQGGFQLLPVG